MQTKFSFIIWFKLYFLKLFFLLFPPLFSFFWEQQNSPFPLPAVDSWLFFPVWFFPLLLPPDLCCCQLCLSTLCNMNSAGLWTSWFHFNTPLRGETDASALCVQCNNGSLQSPLCLCRPEQQFHPASLNMTRMPLCSRCCSRTAGITEINALANSRYTGATGVS